MTTRISCDAHDYFEIVCMRRSSIKVTTHCEEIITGTAINIIVVDSKEVLQVNDKDNIHFIALTDVKRLQALGNNEQHNFVFEF